MNKSGIFILVIAIAVFTMGKRSYAQESSMLSRGNLMFEENIGIYDEDFVYLYHEIQRLKAECK